MSIKNLIKPLFKRTVARSVNSFSGVLLETMVLTAMAIPVWVHAAPKQNLNLQQSIQKVKAYQASQGLWDAQHEIVAANKKQAKLWINPSLSIDQTGFKSKQDKELNIAVSQKLDIFGERNAKKKLAEISSEQSNLQQRIYQAELELVVKYLWSQLAIAEVERDVVFAQLQTSLENLQAAEKRYLAGNLAQVDLDRVKITHSENQRIFNQAELQLQIAQRDLSQLWGESSLEISAEQSSGAIWPLETAQTVQQYLSDNFSEKSLALQIAESKANVDFLKAQARPNPTLSAGVKRTSSQDNRSENELLLGVEIPLNIFNRNQYSIHIAKAKQDLLDRQQAFYQQQNRLKVNNTLYELEKLSEQFQQVQKVQLPLVTGVQHKTLEGFKAGKFAVSDVQQATQQLQEIRLRRVQILKDAWEKAIRVESMSIGISPEKITAKDALNQINEKLGQNIQALPVIGGE
ncbi:TolC family protein [Acinetobacter stercoris]|uniref:Cobalt-zinc-cadmium resistance protein CzcC n=1 Tax=Acinetobacter stercoris TaxID=2126983 RepID=A0A2U3N050_9GAMM|nr:TolC family protein [Acinetobacter stercoris]SPL71057.1 Cobalt-zinc-cadmium resistance protein CzcC precursor [Acinetobacter stercoris]